MTDERDEDKPVFMISVAARLTGMHPQTLRIYERKALVRPGRTEKSTRLYSKKDIERLKDIQRLTRAEGVNLAGVKIIIELQRKIDAIKKVVSGMEAEMAETEERLAREVERAGQRGKYELVVVPRKREIMKR